MANTSAMQDVRICNGAPSHGLPPNDDAPFHKDCSESSPHPKGGTCSRSRERQPSMPAFETLGRGVVTHLRTRTVFHPHLHIDNGQNRDVHKTSKRIRCPRASRMRAPTVSHKQLDENRYTLSPPHFSWNNAVSMVFRSSETAGVKPICAMTSFSTSMPGATSMSVTAPSMSWKTARSVT